MRHFLLLGALMLFQSVMAQDTYYKSSIITLQNDTIRGFISDIYDSKSIKFKNKKEDKPLVYTANMLKGYILDGNVFESKRVSAYYYTNSSTSLGEVESRLTKDIAKGRWVDTVFLHKLVSGTVSLYKVNIKKGFTYYFAQKNGVLMELPPQYCTVTIDSHKVESMQKRQESGWVSTSPFTTFIHINDDYLDTLSYLLEDKRYIKLPSQTFTYNQKSLSSYIGQYNKKTGTPNGGLLKTKVSRKIFTGINAGLVYLNYDENITDANAINGYAFKLYGLYSLSGINRNVFAKFGFNYFTYSNDYYKKSIPSASFGLRYSSITGYFRPFAEASVAVASLNRDNRPVDLGVPLILEFGANVPIKNFYLTAGITHTPIVVYKLNGYKLWAFNVGVMF